MIYPGDVTRALEEYILLLLDGTFYISVKAIWSNVSFKADVFLLIFLSGRPIH